MLSKVMEAWCPYTIFFLHQISCSHAVLTVLYDKSADNGTCMHYTCLACHCLFHMIRNRCPPNLNLGSLNWL